MNSAFRTRQLRFFTRSARTTPASFDPEGIATLKDTFDLACHRAQDGQSNFAVVRKRRQHERGAPPGLLVSRLRIEGDPDRIATGRNVVPGHYQISRPTGELKSTSAWRFFLFTFAISCLRDNLFFWTGVATTFPSETARFSTVPSFTSASSASGFGILTAKLFPHF